MQRSTVRTAIVVLAAGLLGPAALAVNIETVPVGDPGNARDPSAGNHGSVAYTYNIDKYEVTAGQ